MNREELAWSAGFFDGEGTTVARRLSRRSVGARITMKQVEREPLERFLAAVGVGVIHGPRRHPNPNSRPFFSYETRNLGETITVVAALWTFLSTPKREQAHRALRAALEATALVRSRCLNGHEHPRGGLCPECARERRARWRAKQAS